MFKTLILTAILFFTTTFTAFADEKNNRSPREAAIEKAVAKQQTRHFEIHHFYIPTTQGNLQWLAATVGAKPDEAILVWKLMRDWDSRLATRNSTVSGPS